MNSAPRPIDRLAILLTLGLCLAWGFNQVAAKVTLADFGPVTQAALRSGIGSAMLIGYSAFWRRGVFRRDGTLGPGLVIGLLFAFEFIALFLALKVTTASSAVVFLFTAPFFVALGVVFLPHERLLPRQWVGMALAFVGVAAGLYRSTPGATLAGDLLALLAGALWGATTVVMKATRLKYIEPIKTLLYQTLMSTFVSGAWAYFAGERWPAHVSGLSALGLSYQAIFVVGITYPVWFWLLKTYRAGELSAFTFTSPVVGVFAGYALLGEPLTAGFLAALGLVAGGLLVVNWPGNAFIYRVVARAGRRNPG